MKEVNLIAPQGRPMKKEFRIFFIEERPFPAIRNMYIKVKVTPDAKKEKLEQKGEELFEISVREKAKQNMANERVREIMARHFGIMKGNVRIISGHRSPSKIISIDND